ncbi:hypothetical protein PR048_019203 [Dryococelus australis]|uniref:Uncharacterized protein n=1 Tax=Dryococelus australis TaxID=614101 RepID=A0ABQ9H2Y9_9NEOP|nr:hypothetical protein PR048_019203 [Dryococelus australis]
MVERETRNFNYSYSPKYPSEELLLEHRVEDRLTPEHIIPIRAAMAERLDCSPPTRANWVQSPAGPLPDFRKWESHWSAGFIGDLPFPPPLRSGTAPFPPHFTFTGSQDLVVKRRPNLSNKLRPIRSHLASLVAVDIAFELPPHPVFAIELFPGAQREAKQPPRCVSSGLDEPSSEHDPDPPNS